MRTTAFLSLAVSLLSLRTNASNSTSNISDIFPELGKLPSTGDYSVAYIDPTTHKLVEDSVPNLSKRGQSYHEDPLVTLLRHKNAYGFCKAYCTGEKPSTITKTKSVTKTATISKTTTSCLNKCIPKTTVRTLKGASLPASIVTKTETVISTESTTVTATESTLLTASADSTITAVEDATITAEPSTSTGYTTETTTTTESTVTTITSTVNFGPTVTTKPVRVRDVKYPPYLRGYKYSAIEAACKILNKPLPKTITVTRVKTISSTHVRTLTSVPATVTLLATSTPLALTHTTALTDVSTVTETSTLTTTETLTTTATYLHSTTSTAFATITPVVITTVTATTTETTTSTSSVTTSVCPQATYGVSGIAVGPPGQLQLNNAADSVGCCTFCYNTPGCNGWAFLGPRFCFAAFSAPPNQGTPTAQCPFGLGSYALGTGGPSELAGGNGLCALDQTTFN